MTLDARTECELARRYEAGLMAQHLLDAGSGGGTDRDELTRVAADGQAAFAALVEGNRGLVAWEANRWAKRWGLDVDELMQEGYLGLLEGARRWDRCAGKRFGSYASWWIREYVRLAAASRAGASAVTGSVTRNLLRGRLSAENAAVVTALGHSASIFTEDGVLPLAAEPTTISDDDLVEEALCCLTRRERVLIRMRFGLGTAMLSVADRAAAVGLSRRRLAEVESKALQKMRIAVHNLDQVA